MNLDKKSPRGTLLMAISSDNTIAAFQWSDSKVVNCVSSYLHFGVSRIHRQVGSSRLPFTCPTALVHYQHNMGAVDKVDQIRKHFGGFAGQSHFKKWYKKTIMAVLDCMLVNGLMMWNMSAERIPERRKMSRFEFLQVVAHELLHYKTEMLMSPVNSPEGVARRQPANGDDDDRVEEVHESIECIGKKPRCIVCNLEMSQYRYALEKAKKSSSNSVDDQLLMENREATVKRAYEGLRRNVATCKQCGVFAHTAIPVRNRKFVHDLFPGRTCMEILHSPTGREIWRTRTTGKKKNSVNYKHQMVAEIRHNVSAVMMVPS